MNRFILLVLLVLSGAMQGLTNQPGPTAIVGRWQPVNTKVTLEIYALQGWFYGKVMGPTTAPRLDSHTPYARLRGRALLGAVILQDFRFDERRIWTGGIIYDPNNGRTYKNDP